jgi:3-deoxy-manno-octulosonate cytidylyltransferase (CMP-KDO synthetase)
MRSTQENTVCVIPARYASTRFPGKPLAIIGGKPMVQRVYEQASKALQWVYVATDDKRIAEAVANFGGRYIMTAEHHQSGTDRIAEAADILGRKHGLLFDIIVNVQGDEPFIKPEQIEMLLANFNNEKTDIATLVKKIDDEETLLNPNSPKVVLAKDMSAMYFSRSPIPYLRGKEHGNWASSGLYYKHLGIYAYRSASLTAITKLEQSGLELAESLEQLRWLENGFRISASVTDFESLAVDTPQDLERINR